MNGLCREQILISSDRGEVTEMCLSTKMPRYCGLRTRSRFGDGYVMDNRHPITTTYKDIFPAVRGPMIVCRATCLFAVFIYTIMNNCPEPAIEKISEFEKMNLISRCGIRVLDVRLYESSNLRIYN